MKLGLCFRDGKVLGMAKMKINGGVERVDLN